MSAPTTPAPLDDDAYQRALATILDVGTAILLELKVPDPAVPVTARAAAFDRVAEAVRRTIILSKHITQTAAAAHTKHAAARKQIIRAVQDNIQRAAPPADAEALRLELLERVDAPEFIDDVDNRPPGDLIAELCRDLGLATALPGLRPALRRTPDDIAVLCAQAAAEPGSGLPQWLAAATPQAIANDAAPPPPDIPAPSDLHLRQRRHL